MIGILPTVGLILLTAMLGVYLLRQQSWKMLKNAQDKMGSGQLPAKEMAEGLFLAVGGALLLTPGFVTDGIGFCCLLPGSRHWLMSILVAPLVRRFKSNPNAHFSSFTMNAQSNGSQFQNSHFQGSHLQDSQSSNGRSSSESLDARYSEEGDSNSRSDSHLDNQPDKNGDIIDGEFKREDD